MTASQGTPEKENPISDERLAELIDLAERRGSYIARCETDDILTCLRAYRALRSREAALTEHVDRVRSIKADIAEFDGDRRGMYDALDKAEKALVDAVLSAHPARGAKERT